MRIYRYIFKGIDDMSFVSRISKREREREGERETGRETEREGERECVCIDKNSICLLYYNEFVCVVVCACV